MTVLPLVMVLASSVTVFASEPSLQRPEDPVNESNYVIPGYQGRKYSIKDQNVALRKEPSLSGKVLGIFYKYSDDWVVLTGEFSSADGIEWAQVSDSSLGLGGWVALHLLGQVIN